MRIINEVVMGSKKITPSLKGYLMILASALCFGSYGVWSRLLGEHFGGFYQGWVRSALILLVLLPILITGKHFKPIAPKDRKWFAITIAFTVFTQVPLYYAFNHLTLGTATLIFYALFLITSYAIGWLFLAEKMTPIKVISILLALAGLLLTFGLSLTELSLIAMLLAGLNGVASGGEIATSKKSTHKYSSLQIIAYSWILILITHLPISIIIGEPQIKPVLNTEWMAMFGYALSGLFGFWLAVEGFRHVDASIGSLIGLLEIPFSVIFGVLFFSDQLTTSIIFGGIIILLSAVLPDLYALKHKRSKPIHSPWTV
jgi:drug/metabolite transporter (DMT)-like permease